MTDQDTGLDELTLDDSPASDFLGFELLLDERTATCSARSGPS